MSLLTQHILDIDKKLLGQIAQKSRPSKLLRIYSKDDFC